MKPTFTKHKNDNNGHCASIPRTGWLNGIDIMEL